MLCKRNNILDVMLYGGYTLGSYFTHSSILSGKKWFINTIFQKGMCVLAIMQHTEHSTQMHCNVFRCTMCTSYFHYKVIASSVMLLELILNVSFVCLSVQIIVLFSCVFDANFLYLPQYFGEPFLCILFHSIV